MEENYLDITKSVMISSPAGSGKTEKLARRYIALLKGGSEVERILAITFTDKAAAEMKERIISILRREDPALFDKVREKMPRMRISTIHSFCLKLMKRFCLELGMDLSLEVMDSFNAGMLWEESVYEELLMDGASEERLFYDVIKAGGIKGWSKLFTILNNIHEKRPAVEWGLNKSESGIAVGDHPHFEKVVTLYSRCLKRYTNKKRARHSLDYNDLELLAYEAVSENPEWQNILYSFDEHTDHILVDEFQDTSTLQWMIIDKLTEEWRSGMGAKREAGSKPTIFLVGDDKQSIYSFRGANVGIFRNARNRLAEWLGEEYHFVELKENYRSLPAIVHFVNSLFERIMPKGLYESAAVEYIPFDATRTGEGRVELLLCESAGNTKENRRREALITAGKIRELAGVYEVYEGGARRKCRYGDIAVLLRNRTHLSLFEDALRNEGIPFVVVKGIGFYNTPEIGILRELLFFLIDPMSDYSLFTILRSPLFSIPYNALLKTVKDIVTQDISIGYLFTALSAEQGGSQQGPVREAVGLMGTWVKRAGRTPYAVLIENILNETGAWKYFVEKQRYVNVKKFIKLVEEFEGGGHTGLEIREKLIKASARSDEPKANVNTEGMDAVKIMTTHAAKGLQFPMVLLPCLDEGSTARSGSVVVDEEGASILLGYEEDPEARRTAPLFRRQKEKAEDEEKRLFYVAATRAMDYLCMSGVMGKKPTGKLAYLCEAFGIGADGRVGDGPVPFSLHRISTDEALMDAGEAKRVTVKTGTVSKGHNEMVYTETLHERYQPATLWRDVTEETDDIRTKHGDDWVALGRAFHAVFEGLSRGLITLDTLEERTQEILKNEMLSGDMEKMKALILSDIVHLESAGYLGDIILPQADSYAELPFILEVGRSIYKGRIDRIIRRDGIAHIYDYKTYPVSEKEIPELRERYAFQMGIYRKAVERLFSMEAKTHIFFTHAPAFLV
jgi:ATP-dependent exoDNAse (exonuclease V) beta subunit